MNTPTIATECGVCRRRYVIPPEFPAHPYYLQSVGLTYEWYCAKCRKGTTHIVIEFLNEECDTCPD